MWVDRNDPNTRSDCSNINFSTDGLVNQSTTTELHTTSMVRTVLVPSTSNLC